MPHTGQAAAQWEILIMVSSHFLFIVLLKSQNQWGLLNFSSQTLKSALR